MEEQPQPVVLSPGSRSSEMKVVMVATALTALTGAFHKQLDMDQATKLIDALAALYVMGRSAVKMAHSIASAVISWAAQQKAAKP